MTKEEGYNYLVDVIEHDIRHVDYERVTDLADKYYKLYTGEGICELLRQIATRETDEEFEQRRNITKSIIPATLASTRLPFQKAVRKQPLVRSIIYEGGDNNNKVMEIESFINTFWGDMSLEEYLEYAFIEYNYIDPNAFLITEFDEFDPKVEKPSPYPFVATSKDAIMFEYENERLQYLIVRLPHQFVERIARTYKNRETTKDVIRDGWIYTLYMKDDIVKLTQVPENYTGDGETVLTSKGRFIVEYFQPKGVKLPAKRFGYIRDTVTAGRTFISVFHSILLLLEKNMKLDSEFDLTTSLTAFPQRFAYVDKCQQCNNGRLPSGDICTVCRGTGKETLHGSTMDVVTLAMPRTAEEMLDLNNLLIYKYPPIDLLTFQKDYSSYLRTLVYSMMFNADLFSQSEVQVAATATEKILQSDNINDTLYPFARAYSAMWEFVVTDIAAFTDLIEGLSVQHKFPNDFKFKSLIELMNELKVARDAGASASTISAIENDINEILYYDRPKELKKIRIKNMINPFRGYDEANVRLLISQGKTTKANAVLWANMESIFNELEIEEPEIYQYEISKLRDTVNRKVQQYIEMIDSENEKEEIINPFKFE